jgi:hypothetical protein
VNGGANCIEPLGVFCDPLYASLGDFDVWMMRAEPERCQCPDQPDRRHALVAATVAATEATLGGIQRTIITAHTLEIGLFAGHIDLLRYAADVSLCDYESEGRRFESCRARPSFSCKSSVFALDISLRAGLYHLFD